MVSKLWDPGSGSLLFIHPGSRCQKGTGSRIRIRMVIPTVYAVQILLLNFI